MIKLTRAAKGTAYGDVSNTGIRNILSEISKSMNGGFTVDEMEKTMEFFDWRCPYTGIDLRDNKDRQIDHICPQNKESCGLNIIGNLVYVDKTANSKKGNKSVEDFLLNNKDVIKDIDVLGRTRQERIDKIKEFQHTFGYDPEKIRNTISPLIQKQYDDIRKHQESLIEENLKELKKNGIKVLTTNVIQTPNPKSSINVKTDLIFYPNDEKMFVNEFLKKKTARIILTYASGAVKPSTWKCNVFNANSNLKANIKTRPFWRSRKQEGLIKVEVFVD